MRNRVNAVQTFLSIIVPAYNAELFLQECLDSIYTAAEILARTALEVIIVDDGSNDGTLQICENWRAKCLRGLSHIAVQVIHQQNRGVGAARNCGIECAHGTWLWFVDADDMLHPESLRILSAALETVDADAVFLALSEGEEFCPIRKVSLSSVPLVGANVERLHRSVWSTLFRRDLLGELRFKNYVLGEDILFSMTYLNNHRRWVELDAPLYYYRPTPGSASHRTPTLRRVQDWLHSSYEITVQLGGLTAGLNTCVSWYPYGMYYTYDESLFRLSWKEARKCFPDYMKLVNLVSSLWPLKRRHRCVLWLLNLFPSYLFARLLNYYPHRLFMRMVLHK